VRAHYAARRIDIVAAMVRWTCSRRRSATMTGTTRTTSR
jgi:hypothetical protein